MRLRAFVWILTALLSLESKAARGTDLFVPDSVPVKIKQQVYHSQSVQITSAKKLFSGHRFYPHDPNWKATVYGADRLLLTNSRIHKSILINRFANRVASNDFESYLKSAFRQDAIQSRKQAFNGSDLRIIDFAADQVAIQDQSVGRISYSISYEEYDALFTEYLWNQGSAFWHITIASTGAFVPEPGAHDIDFQAVLQALTQSYQSKKFSWMSGLIESAYASNSELRAAQPSANIDPNQSGQFHLSVTQKECEDAYAKFNISPELRAAPGFKISPTLDSFTPCSKGGVEGVKKVLEATKSSFISSFHDVETKAQSRAEAMRCKQLEDEATKNPTQRPFWKSVLNIASDDEVVQNCYNSAVGAGTFDVAEDSVRKTADTAKKLAAYVWDIKNSSKVFLGMIQAKMPAFACVNQQEQTKLFCAFIGGATAVVGSAVVVGVATGGIGELGEGASLASIGRAALDGGAAAAKDLLMQPVHVVKTAAKAPAQMIRTAGKVAGDIAEKTVGSETVDHASSAARSVSAHSTIPATVNAKGQQALPTARSPSGEMERTPSAVPVASQGRATVDILTDKAKAQGFDARDVMNEAVRRLQTAEDIDDIISVSKQGVLKIKNSDGATYLTIQTGQDLTKLNPNELRKAVSDLLKKDFGASEKELSSEQKKQIEERAVDKLLT